MTAAGRFEAALDRIADAALIRKRANMAALDAAINQPEKIAPPRRIDLMRQSPLRHGATYEEWAEALGVQRRSLMRWVCYRRRELERRRILRDSRWHVVVAVKGARR